MTVRKTWITRGKSNKREWHDVIEIEWAQYDEVDYKQLHIFIYLLNKYFTGAKAVYSVGDSSGVKPLFFGMYTEENKKEYGISD